MDAKTESSIEHLTLDDLQVGQKFRSKSHHIDAAQIKSFAGKFDPQPFHLDEAAAQKSLFGGLVASGWHTAAITMRLLVASAPIAGGLVGVGGEISWPKPTKPGDTLHVETEVLEIKPSRSRPDRGIVTVRSVTFNQEGQALQILTSKLIVPRREVSELRTAHDATQGCSLQEEQ